MLSPESDIYVDICSKCTPCSQLGQESSDIAIILLF